MRATLWVTLCAAVIATAGCQPGQNGGGLGPTGSTSAPPTLKSLRPYQVGAANLERGTCNIDANTIWNDTARGRYRIEAVAVGETCVDAKVSIAIRAPSKRVIMRQNFDAAEIKDFAGVVSPTKMRSALIAWMTNDGRSGNTSRSLPSWVEAQYSRLVLDPSVTREQYVAVRDAGRPMLCFADTLTTKRCVVLSADGGSLERIGHIDMTR